jgi:ABC-2 type transport system permease protein
MPAVETLHKYWNIYRVSLIERLAYRGDFLLGTILRFLPMVTTILLWDAVFRSADHKELGSGPARYTYSQMIAYLLLVHISRMFSSMPGLAVGIAHDIRSGDLKKYLLQPLDMIGYLLAYRTAHKTAYIATSFIPYALLFIACGAFFDTFPEPATFGLYLLSLLLGFLVGFFFEVTIGMVGFWFLEVTSFLYVINTLNWFVSGQMFPLDLLPSFWANLFKLLPFQYLAYFPAAVFLGKVPPEELIRGILVQATWAVALILLSRVLYQRGLRYYSAYGG